jgi:hypothetical protein
VGFVADEMSERSAVPRATTVLMMRFDVSPIMALRLLATIADRSAISVEILAQRVVASSGLSKRRVSSP